MTHQFRLKILGLGLVLVGLGACLLRVFRFYPQGDLGIWIVLGGWLLPIIGLGCYARAKRRSVFWAAIGVVPILGPILVLAAMGIDDAPAKHAASPLVRRVRKSAILLGLLLLSVPHLLLFKVSFDLLRAEQSNNFYGGLHDSLSHSGLAYVYLIAGGIWFLALGYLALRKKTTLLERVLAGVCWSGVVVAVVLAGTPTHTLPVQARYYVMREIHSLERTWYDFGAMTDRMGMRLRKVFTGKL